MGVPSSSPADPGIARLTVDGVSDGRSRPYHRPLIAAAVALTAALSGCAGEPAQGEFQGGAGLDATVGDVRLVNLLVVSGQESGPGILCGSADNVADQQRSVDIRFASGSGTSMTVPPRGRAELHCEGNDPVVLDNVPEPPGALAQATLTSNGATTTSQVPVLYPYEVTPYGTLAPPGFTPRPTAASSAG